jgi:hypothetical protein
MWERKLLFMGNGDHSSARCRELSKQLERAFEMLNGIQQGGEVPSCNLRMVYSIAQRISQELIGRSLDGDVPTMEEYSEMMLPKKKNDTHRGGWDDTP